MKGGFLVDWKLYGEQVDWLTTLQLLQEFDLESASLQEKLNRYLMGEGIGFEDILEVFEVLKEKQYISFEGDEMGIEDLKITQAGKYYFDRLKDYLEDKYIHQEKYKEEILILREILDLLNEFKSTRDKGKKDSILNYIKDQRKKITVPELIQIVTSVVGVLAQFV